MIFVSDLDQTLIYSGKFIDHRVENRVMPIEVKDDKVISYVFTDTFLKLKSLMEQLIFIPATTRTLEQYKRIQIFRDRMIPEYAVVNHGASILINGETDVCWQKHVRNNINQQCEGIKKVKENFQSEIGDDSWVLDIREVEDLFFYCIIECERAPHNELETFMTHMDSLNWKSCLHGRKLYFMPKTIHKGNAVEYIRNLLPDHKIVASGDSLMDLELLKMADYSIVPAHGEAFDALKDSDMCVKTVSQGFPASLEILERVEQLLDDESLYGCKANSKALRND